MIDIALAYDPNRRCCDVVFNGTDFALDATPASVTLMSILAYRRLHPDDPLPDPVPDYTNPTSFTARGGYPGDALDPGGQLIGSRLQLLQRRDNSEQTRVDAENYLAEGLDWLNTKRGLAVSLAVRWFNQGLGILAFRTQVGTTIVQLTGATS